VDTLERVCEIVADVTQNPVETIGERSTANNVDGWDAIAQVSIVAAIEMDFGISFSEEEAPALNSVRKIMQALRLQQIAA
jgi:acyl carrier protein